jgi:hypothetical protein
MSNETNNTTVVEEPVKKHPKLKKIGSNLAVAGVYGLWIGGIAGTTYVSYKVIQMNLETAKYQLEAAKNAAQK